jgi:uncharacterized protein YyaL (SSP411 family)
MARGGIHDQIGGGFARYSVDSRWLVPHFEKMLYDNAQLARLFLWAGVELDRPDFVAVARSALDYMLRDLRHPDGGFFSSEDADSEGIEGKFYVWSIEEIHDVLGDDAGPIVDYYGVTDGGNFEGANILFVAGSEEPENLEESKRALLRARSHRIRPGLDDKVIASWNGLAIRALAEAGAALKDETYLRAASHAAGFVLDNLVVDGRLMRSWREGRTSVAGFLDDHSSLAVGLFALFSATGEPRWYEAAQDLVANLDSFASPEGGFYATAEGESDLIKRPTDNTDNPLPSGNALAAEALLLSGLFTGDPERHRATESALSSSGLLMRQYPSMVGHHLAVSHSLGRAKELAVVGADWPRLVPAYWARYRPHIALAVGSVEDSAVPLLSGRHQEGKTLAYLCQGFVCDLPTGEVEELARQLGRSYFGSSF